ncbi:hypothetical protein GCM10010837_37700 [Aminobacter niigataensis]
MAAPAQRQHRVADERFRAAAAGQDGIGHENAQRAILAVCVCHRAGMRGVDAVTRHGWWSRLLAPALPIKQC